MLKTALRALTVVHSGPNQRVHSVKENHQRIPFAFVGMICEKATAISSWTSEYRAAMFLVR